MTMSLNAGVPLETQEAPIIGAVDPEQNKPTDHDRANGIDVFTDGGETAETLESTVENFFNPEGMTEEGIAEHHQFATEEDERQYEKISFAIESFSGLISTVKVSGMSVDAANEAIAIDPDVRLRNPNMYSTVPSGTLLTSSLEAFSEKIKAFLEKLLGWISKAWKKLAEKAKNIFKRDHKKKAEETDSKLEEVDVKLQEAGKREEEVFTDNVRQAEAKGPEAKKKAEGKEKVIIDMAQSVVNKSQTNPWVAHALGSLSVANVLRQMSAMAGEVQSVISGSVGSIRPGSADRLNEAAAKLVSGRFFTMGNSLNVAKTEAVPSKETIGSVRDAMRIFGDLKKNRERQASSLTAVVDNLQTVNNSIQESDKALDTLENLNNLGDFSDSERAAVKTFTDAIKQAGSHLNDILDFVHAMSMINELLLKYGNMVLSSMFGEEVAGNESIDIPGLELLGWVGSTESQISNIFDYFGDLDEAAFEQELERDRVELDPGIPASESYDSAGPLGVGDNPTNFNMNSIRSVQAMEAFNVSDKVKQAIDWIRKKVYAMIKKVREWYNKIRHGNADGTKDDIKALQKLLDKPNPKLEQDEAVVARVQKQVKNAYSLMTMTTITANQGVGAAKDFFDAILRSYSVLLREIKNVTNSNNGLDDVLERLSAPAEDFSTVWSNAVKAGKEPVQIASGVYEPINKLLKDNEAAQKIIPSNLDIGSIVKQSEDVIKLIDKLVGDDQSKSALELVRLSSKILSISSSLVHTLAAQQTGMNAPAFFLAKTLKKEKSAFDNEDKTSASNENIHDQSKGLFSDVPRALRNVPREPVDDEPRRIEESSGLLGTPFGNSAVYAQYP